MLSQLQVAILRRDEKRLGQACSEVDILSALVRSTLKPLGEACLSTDHLWHDSVITVGVVQRCATVKQSVVDCGLTRFAQRPHAVCRTVPRHPPSSVRVRSSGYIEVCFHLGWSSAQIDGWSNEVECRSLGRWNDVNKSHVGRENNKTVSS